MAFTVTCRGTAKRVHNLHSVAQFRYDGGWARVGVAPGDIDLLSLPTGDIVEKHHFHCPDPLCRNKDVTFATPRIYGLLTWAREHGSTEIPLS